jgi:signal transduction histidine kinase
MKAHFRILHLENSAEDCLLVQHLLKREGIDCEVDRCGNRAGFIHALETGEFDLIFADCTVPNFSGQHALALARELAPQVPFIFVSGALPEDSAIESLRDGATDYVLKDQLARLGPAVRRALAEVEEKARSREMEQRLRQAQRLEAVGTLAGGIAHDFNNILTIIKGYTAMLSMESGDPEKVSAIARTIDRASLRGTELINQLLAFARKSEGAFTSTSLNQRVREITSMLRPAMPPNVTFEVQLAEQLPEIHADPGQVERVLINLATNARDAMPEGGKIIFSTRVINGRDLPTPAAREDEQYISLSVTDTGFGMDEATRQRIFEPFFTTKPRGKGTGLGMPVVYGLMQSHNGLIDVQSEPGKGTSITLYFPIPAEPVAQTVELTPEAHKSVDGNETVLIVDDESDVRYFLEVILSSHGYSVHSARHAEEAIEMLGDHQHHSHLLFSDVGLPGMDGFELCRRAREIAPDLKTILCSGYSDASLKTKMAEQGIDGFVPKPYEMNELLQVIRGILDKEKSK